MTDYKQKAIEMILSEVEKLKPVFADEVEIDDFYPYYDTNEYLVIKGVLRVEEVEHDEGNRIDGHWEQWPSDLIAKMTFVGKVTLEDEDKNVIETIEITDEDIND